MSQVDIFLPTYNGGSYLADAIESIVSQTYPHWHLTIIDDGSTDNTVEIAESFQRTHPGSITLLRKQGQKGAPASRMEAAAATSRDLIAFIDQDDFWHAEKLECQVKLMDQTGADLCYSDVEIVASNGALMPKAALAENAKRRTVDTSQGPDELAKRFMDYCPIRIGTAILKRSVFESIGGFNAKLFGGEDWDFFMRFVLSGSKICYAPKPLAFRRVHGENTSIKHSFTRMQSWMRAAQQLEHRYNHLNKYFRKFYRETGRREITKNLKANNKEYAMKVASFFRDEGLIPRSDQLKYALIFKLWPTLIPLVRSYFFFKDRVKMTRNLIRVNLMTSRTT